MCNIQLLKYQAAISDLKKVMQIEPGNTSVKSQLESTQKLVRRIEFEKVRIYLRMHISSCLIVTRPSK